MRDALGLFAMVVGVIIPALMAINYTIEGN